MLLLLALLGCAPQAPGGSGGLDFGWVDGALQGDEPGNVLVILMDDLGLDTVAAYDAHPDPPATPTLDQLAAEGLLFRNAYADPFCSPTRAGILTGTYGHRNGFGTWLHPSDPFELRSEDLTLPEALDGWGTEVVDHAAIGKWHLGPREGEQGGETRPFDAGFDWYQGGLNNVGGRSLDDGEWENWWHYVKVDNGEVYVHDHYITQDETDDALAVMPTMQEPWFVYLAYHAAHEPWKPPPPELNPDGVQSDASNAEIFRAMVTSLDMEIGRLLSSMDPDVLSRTTVIVLGDNGTDPRVKTGPEAGLPAKGTVYQGGIQVPMIVAGPRVAQPGREVDALVLHTDLFATVLDLLGSNAPVPAESISIVPYLVDPSAEPRREDVFTEYFRPNGLPDQAPLVWNRAILDGRFKLIRTPTGEELYYLPSDPKERENLLDEPLGERGALAYADLSARLDAIEFLADLPLP